MKYYYCPFANPDDAIQGTRERLLEKNSTGWVGKRLKQMYADNPNWAVTAQARPRDETQKQAWVPKFGGGIKEASVPAWARWVKFVPHDKDHGLRALKGGDTLYLCGHGVGGNPNQLTGTNGAGGTLSSDALARYLVQNMALGDGMPALPIMIKCLVCWGGIAPQPGRLEAQVRQAVGANGKPVTGTAAQTLFAQLARQESGAGSFAERLSMDIAHVAGFLRRHIVVGGYPGEIRYNVGRVYENFRDGKEELLLGKLNGAVKWFLDGQPVDKYGTPRALHANNANNNANAPAPPNNNANNNAAAAPAQPLHNG